MTFKLVPTLVLVLLLMLAFALRVASILELNLELNLELILGASLVVMTTRSFSSSNAGWPRVGLVMSSRSIARPRDLVCSRIGRQRSILELSRRRGVRASSARMCISVTR